MDIRNWPIDKIMQLPDCVFGSRWEIIFSHHFLVQDAVYQMSDKVLPDHCVLWECNVWFPEITTGAASIWAYCSIALGNTLPTTAAQFEALENLMPGCQEVITGIRTIRGEQHLVNLRKPIEIPNRRVVTQMISAAPGIFDFSIALVFSSIPQEVPEWLISGPGRGL